MDPLYYPRLIRVRELLEKNLPQFPHSWCYVGARAVNKAVGLREVGGAYDGSFHIWNYDPKRKLYIDICHDQFNKNRKIYIGLKEGSLYKANNSSTAKQRKTSDEMLFSTKTLKEVLEKIEGLH